MHAGFVGLGAMGAPMARNLADAGHDLTVWNRTPGKAAPFGDAGHDVADAPVDVAAAAEAVFVMVTGPDALREVTIGDRGIVAGVTDETVVVNSSTVSAEAVEEVATAVAGAGGLFVDAPVLGTVGPAERGDLVVMVGGDDDAVGRVEPLLEVLGDPVLRVGGVGDATNAKLATNLLLGDMMQAFAEALAFASERGVDPGTFGEVVDAGVLASPLYSVKGEAIRDREFDAQFPVDLLFKDLNLALEAAGDEGVPLPATGATREAVSATRALGYGDQDVAALVKHLEAVTGTRVE